MKSLILLTLLLPAQMAFAGLMSRPEPIRNAVERSPIHTELVNLRSQGRELSSNAELLRQVREMINVQMRDVMTLNDATTNRLLKIIAIKPTEVLAEILYVNSVVRNTSLPQATRDNARQGLELMVLAADQVSLVTRNSAEARAQELLLTNIMEVSQKISTLNYGASSEAFIRRYIAALRNGETPAQAIRTASEAGGRRFEQEDLLSCT